MNTINNDIPYVPENTIDPAAGLNLSLKTVDALLQSAVLGLADDPPATPADGDRYIVGAGTGAWAGKNDLIAQYLDGAWSFYAARYAVNLDDGLLYFRAASGWSAADTGGTAFADITGSPDDNAARAAALDSKVEKVPGKQLSAEDFTAENKQSVEDLAASAASMGADIGSEVAAVVAESNIISNKSITAFSIGSGESASLSASYSFSKLDGAGLISTDSTRNRAWLAAATGANYVEVILPFGVMIGDSIAEGHPGAHGRLHQSYETPTFNDAILNEFGTPAFELSRRTGMFWFNSGIGGETTAQVLARFERDGLGATVAVGDGRPDNTLPRKPVWIWVNAGINDVSALTDTLVTKSNLLRMALIAFKAGVKIGFNTIGPVSGHNATQRAMQDDINQYILTVLPLYGAHTFDFHSWFVDPANSAAINPLYNADGVHPSKIGYTNFVARLLSDADLPIYFNGLTLESLGESYSSNYRSPTSVEFESESGMTGAEIMSGQFGYFNPRISVLTSPKIKVYVRDVIDGVNASRHSGFSNVYGVIGYRSQRGVIPASTTIPKRVLGGTLIKISGTWQVWGMVPSLGIITVTVNDFGNLGLYVLFGVPVILPISGMGSSTTKAFFSAVVERPARPACVRVRMFDAAGTELDPASQADNTAVSLQVVEE